jgi:hypothetical protein
MICEGEREREKRCIRPERVLRRAGVGVVLSG